MTMRLCHPLRLSSSTPPILRRQPRRSLRCSAENQTIQSLDTRKKQDTSENEKLCVYLIEKALRKLPPGQEEILGIFDLRGFQTGNADVMFLKYLLDVLYYYYPRRLGHVLFVEAPFVFQPIWGIFKPLLKSYASLVRFCDVETVRKEYFTEETVPNDFRN